MSRTRTPTRIEAPQKAPGQEDTAGSESQRYVEGASDPSPLAPGLGTASDKGIKPGPIPFRPQIRPPMALLVVIDDGSTNGMVIRLLQDETTLGREEADVNIPHDTQVSRNHASILRVSNNASFRWYLQDNQSSNGTFIRVAKTKLKAEQEFLIGSKRFRYQQSSSEKGGDGLTTRNSAATAMWTAVSKEDLESSMPRLVEQRAGSDDGQSILLNRDEVIIGTEARVDARIDDPYLDPRHARITTSHDGRWILEDLNSLNGVWIKVNRIELTAKCEFRIGEQRLLFQPLV